MLVLEANASNGLRVRISPGAHCLDSKMVMRLSAKELYVSSILTRDLCTMGTGCANKSYTFVGKDRNLYCAHGVVWIRQQK